MSPHVVGLDLSMTATGIAWCDGTTYTVKTKRQGDRRLPEICDEISRAVEGRSIDLAVLEEAPPGLKGPAIKAVHMVHGAVRVALLGWRVRYVAVNPTTLKQFATGKAGADKTAMAMALFKRTGREPATSDEVDAWWLRAVGLQLLGEPVVELPKAQVEALDKVRDQLGGAR